MDNLFKKRGIYWVVILISVLLIAKVFISYENSQVIDHNVKVQQEAERIKVNTLDIIRTLHLLDLGIRGYAIIPNDQIGGSYDSAWIRKEKVLTNLEKSLQAQQFEMKHFYKMRDSVNSYFELARKMMNYLKSGERSKFENIFKEDYGYDVWVDYKDFSARIDEFEDAIAATSKKEYELALKWNYLILIFLLILIIPTLLYTAYQTTRTFLVLDKLKESEADKNRILANQNQTLERLVQERTEEIASQNEEILSQNEEITTHNEAISVQRDEIKDQHDKLDLQHKELLEAQKLIQAQNEIIQKSNDSLSNEVKYQTDSLVKANKELAQNISQLEQFTFIVSHNLRAPVARIMGLGAILNNATNYAEIKQIIDNLVKTSKELDEILSDLSLTIQIKKMVNERLQPVDVEAVFKKIKNILLPEIEKSSVNLEENLSAKHLNTIAAYLESILYNLVSNAIKYRNPGRSSFIKVSSFYEDENIELRVEDNGLGMDLVKYESSLFNLYRRFHFHVEGKGLGLYLVKTQVDLLGGEIVVESKVNEGSVFTVRIKHNILS